ncbi:CarboxypepD_reg-like domain-containing protein [Olivibacter domesticus]|uniref:CarboxypepD_reg-like domain-containing protein n=2 Tax=Olivibacter domesticus TaxID=407022 RepID=A0A1H7LPW6_OLID1|nr:CarboxypepD_reg-like domain-containing protein [Olivibacter domesticus]
MYFRGSEPNNMKRLFLFLVFLGLCSLTSFAQNDYSIKGVVTDTSSSLTLNNTSVSILNAQDSMLYKYTRAANGGKFMLSDLEKGNYILLVTYPKYADYVEKFTLDSVKEIDFGDLNLFLKSQLLEEVIITGRQPITIKGDTTEYDAASFKVQPNAKVEDLLKQLPGIQVDKDGKITAQGQTVNKVLVDGEEFFGDDPTLVTKNIRSDMVDKVQLYDKQSDQAAFTGVDDGQKAKTINIQLKEDSKKGYFGKVDAGVGTEDFYQGQAMINKFKGKEKMSAYGTIGNTGKVGLGWRDSDKYGSSSLELSDDGGMFFSSGGDDLESFNGQYNGQGIPLARTGGVHYDNKWNSDKQSINTNYKIGTLDVDGTRSNIVQRNLPSGVINDRSDERFDNHMFRHKLDAKYDIRLDSTTNLRITVDGTLKNSDTENNYTSESRNGDGMLLNNNERSITNSVDDRIFNASALLTKKFKKVGRSFSVNLNQSSNTSKANGFLHSSTNYFNRQTDGVIDSVQNDDQYKTNDVVNNAFRSNVTYTEPLVKNLAVVLNYGLTINSGHSNRQSFNQSADGNYNILDSLYSNDYKLDQTSNQVGAIFNYKTAKTDVNFGAKVSDVKFKQLDQYTDNLFTRNFTNFNPQINYQYKFSQQKSIRIGYNGNNTQPNINQIQPVRVNTDPLNIVLGNPDLKPSFTNRFNMSYYSYKVLSNQYINFYGSYSFTTNPIVSNTVTDASGASTYRSDNLKDKNTANFYGGMYAGKKIKKLDLQVGLNLGTNGNVYYNLTNNDLNQTKSYNYSGELSVSKYKEKKYDFNLSIGPSYNTSESSLQPDFNNNGWGLNGNAGFNIYLPGKIQIGSDGNYMYTQATQSFDENFERFILNAHITKKFFKEENLHFTISGNDLLNQNVGFNRSAFNNTISQSSYTTIRRYFMFSVIWEFNKMGTKP